MGLRKHTSSISSLSLTVAAAAFIATSTNHENISRRNESNLEQVSAKESSNAAITINDRYTQTNISRVNVVSCDSEKPSSDITFRRRRLSINNTNVSTPEEANDSDSDSMDLDPISQSKRQKHRIMYASEFDKDEEKLSGKDSTSSSTNTPPPFPSHQVGTYSCHGIEPQPFVVYDVPELDTDITAYLRKMFVKKSVTDVSARRRPRIITLTKQKINQDRGHIIYPYDSDSRTALFGTYDGHGERGELLAEFTMEELADKLYMHPDYQKRGRGQNIEKAFKEVLSEIDNDILTKDHLSPLNSGSTACVVLLQGKRLWVANVGDSRAVLGSRRKSKSKRSDEDDNTLEVIELTKDQNVHDKEERKRILKAGGFITIPRDNQLPARIWLDENCSQVGLAMSRSIGDHALKHVGVIAEPVVRDYVLNKNDKFFILATDGVWEFISSAEAVEIVDKCFQDGMGASDACKELIRAATEKWKEYEGDYRDDITAMVVRLDGIWDH